MPPRPLRVCLWTPAPVGSRRGNRITSERWSRLLRRQGFQVEHTHRKGRHSGDILIALHAIACREVWARWQGLRRVVVLTGTDLNGPQIAQALQTVEEADAAVVLQPLDRSRMPELLQARTRVILPSVDLPPGLTWQGGSECTALAIGHLREVKQPLTLPQALLLRPDWRGEHLGEEIEAGWVEQLKQFPRFQWLGNLPRRAVLQRLARCACFVISSRSEGCSNALCEALAVGAPVLASDIAGNRGLLGDDFEGYFPVGDSAALARLLEPERLQRLAGWSIPWKERLSPRCEQQELKGLIESLVS